MEVDRGIEGERPPEATGAVGGAKEVSSNALLALRDWAVVEGRLRLGEIK